jgi:two-component system nitrate/nitrite response regulator NarL
MTGGGMTPDLVRVLIADDSVPVRDALADLLADHPRLEVMGAVGDAASAIAFAGEHRPDVVIVDVSMPGGGAYTTREILAVHPHTKVIALSAFTDEQSSTDMRQAGAARYLIKGVLGLDLADAILEVVDEGGAGPDASSFVR